MIGLKRKTIKLLPHQKSWGIFFNKEKNRIAKSIPKIKIEHIGSTAIPSICAKPIIDIVIGIDNFRDLHEYKIKLEKLGYKYHDNRGSRYNKFFTLGAEDCRKVYIHVVKFRGKTWNNYINFRDKLIKNKGLAKQYQTIKIKLSNQFKNRDQYTKAKAEFIQSVNK
ncbi:GrpB family protein [Candidatus Kuenenbacteria bacterium]|nr:GrpB family protein [Candidatus Kuenenbacteria bacterium]